MPLPYQGAHFKGQYNAESVIVTLTMALALYNSVELLLLIFTTFNKYRGLYFWSLTVSTVGIISYCNGLLIEYFSLTKILVGLVLDNIGWMTMITGQSLVLYSRLGLILSNRKILRAVLVMIIVDAFIFHISTTVLNFGARYQGGKGFVVGYEKIEIIQMTFFCLQEFIISGLYVWQTVKLLKVIVKQRTRMVMWQLFIINVVIVALDIVLLVIEYKNLHIYEQSVKAFVYSVKLKLEFAILGKLIDLVQGSQRSLSNALGTVDDCVGRSDSSPSLGRNLSPVSSFPWLNNREKLPIQHVENTGDGKENGHIEAGHVANGDLTVGHFEADKPEQSEQYSGSVSSDARQKGRESDIMYADIVRAISQSQG